MRKYGQIYNKLLKTPRIYSHSTTDLQTQFSSQPPTTPSSSYLRLNLAPSEALGEISSMPFPRFHGFQATLGFLGLRKLYLPLLDAHVTLSQHVGLCPNVPLSKGHKSYWIGAPPCCGGTSSQLVISARTLFPNEVAF